MTWWQFCLTHTTLRTEEKDPLENKRLLEKENVRKKRKGEGKRMYAVLLFTSNWASKDKNLKFVIALALNSLNLSHGCIYSNGKRQLSVMSTFAFLAEAIFKDAYNI